MQERIRAFWDQGVGQKIVVICFGLLIPLCALQLLFGGGGRRQGAAQPTSVPAAVAATIAPQPTKAPAPTAIPEPTKQPEPPPTAAPAQPAGYVSRAMLGDDWPLMVDEGVLACAGSGGVGAVTFSSGGTVYAVNGFAKQRNAGTDIAPIWADDPAIAGIKKNLSPLLERGLALCT